ncbi:AAA family ATPase [Bradyrhizobium yuanmingense]|uniref:AAA family ATPase n=1 Tax=Bradyrhizobium yuanmingense TaxID=108015 RepID=UPI0023BA02EC|nr:AAA family ATPase [Bradyrhizobium yuanmingense]MDF0583306.1 AAA family ATPase [Bradyrhizobium yuanmingense]
MTTQMRSQRSETEVELPGALQESILAVLVTDEGQGGVLAAQVRPQHFDVPYYDIADAVLGFWSQYKKPPTVSHLDDLLIEKLKSDKSQRLMRALINISKLAKAGVNGEYVVSRVNGFILNQELKSALLKAGERFDQGGPEMRDEISDILRPVLESIHADRPQAIATINLRDVKAKQIEWLWQGRIPRGQHITMTGMPFVGKSMLMLYFAAQLSRGKSNPDGTPAPRGRVILLAQEDSIETTLKPRLKALKADMSRIEIVERVHTDKGERGFLLSEDLQKLERLITERGDVLMVGIDPVTGYIGGKLDSHKATDVRAVLEPLNKLAERTGALVLSITHPAKSTKSAINAFVGSQAFIAVPRMGYLVAAEEIDGKETGRVLLACVGSNIGERPTTLAYHKEQVRVPPDEGPDPGDIRRRYKDMLAQERNPDLRRKRVLQWLAEKDTGDIDTAKVVWDEVDGLDISAQEIIGGTDTRGDAMAEAITFLRTDLKGGPKNSTEVAEAAAQLGIAETTLKRAKKKVCRSYRVGPLGSEGRWMCELKNTGTEDD